MNSQLVVRIVAGVLFVVVVAVLTFHRKKTA